jgi:cobalamin synthase
LIFILFFLFGLILLVVSLRNLILSEFSLGLSQYLYLAIGAYVAYSSVKRCIKFYKYSIKDSYNISNKFYQENKIEIIITSIISIIVLFVYYNGLYLNYSFIPKIILFLPIFALQNLVFPVKVYLRAALNLAFLPSVFDLLLPIAEIYYVFVIVNFIRRLFKKLQILI